MTERRPARRPRCRIRRAALLGLCVAAALGVPAWGGDILRGGAVTGAVGRKNNSTGANTSVVTDQARANAADSLARTTQILQSMQAAQNSAHDIAVKAGNGVSRTSAAGVVLPFVPNGLRPGGLDVAPGVPKNLSNPQPGEDSKLWQGARLPAETKIGGESVVTIEQLQQQALLTWRTFNIGKGTRLKFNQGRGGAQQSEWIAFNKVLDPSGKPTQILGKIEATGQVYVLNQNGILFGGSSQINTHSLVASTLPINDVLITRGLLNQEASNVRFLFSSTQGDPAFQIPGGVTTYTLAQFVAAGTAPKLSFSANNNTTTLIAGTDYTLGKDAAGKTVVNFTPGGIAKVGAASLKVDYTSAAGDITVFAGAQLTSPTSAAHVGGRIALVAPNVTNEGTISTPDGQTIIAAGRDVGFAEHPSADPSLRGLDTYVGKVDNWSGVATNAGVIDAPRANVTIIGKEVNQAGVIDSSTSVSLNGRVDLLAAYDSKPTPGFDPTTGGQRPFLPSSTGTVNLGAGSVIRILPELTSEETAVGSELAIRSRVKILGKAIHFGTDSTLLAPNALVDIQAGTLKPIAPESIFVNSAGQIYLDAGAVINVAGTVDVSVPISQNFLELQMRGSELADSPLQRAGILRGTDITIDIRNSGVFNGFAWVGTPLGDASGFVGLIQHNVGELTVAGGTVTMSAGEAFIMQPGSKVDVSGGWINFQGGMVETTRVYSGGQLFDIAQATPDRVYDSIYTGTFTDMTYAKYGVTPTFSSPLALRSTHFEPGYVQGANGGAISITAPAMALDGTLLGHVAAGPRQRQNPAAASELTLAFKGRVESALPGPEFSPTPPRITFQNRLQQAPADPFEVDVNGNPAPLRDERKMDVILSPDALADAGFGKLKIENSDGDIIIPANITLDMPAKGSVTFSAANIDVKGKIKAPGGSLAFTTYNYSPYEPVDNQQATPFQPVQKRGLFRLGAAGVLSAAGTIVDDSKGNSLDPPQAPDGGAVSITTYQADLMTGGLIDVSGGVNVSATGKLAYGNGGSISIAAGQDPGLGRGSDLGGKFVLGSTLSGYSGAKGGSLSLRAQLIQIGGRSAPKDALWLTPEFFSHGGFGSFALTGLGDVTDVADEFVPGVYIAPGTVIAPVAQSLLAVPNVPGSDEITLQKIDLPAGQRTPVSLSFSTPGVTLPNSNLYIRGNFVMGENAIIVTDPKGNVSIDGQTVAVLGSIVAPAGNISITGAGAYPLLGGAVANEARPTVYLGPRSRLSTAGATILLPDAYGRRVGSVLAGGTISVSGNIVAEHGAVLDVSGTSGVLDLPPAVARLTGAVNGFIDGASVVPYNSGLNAPLWSLRSVATQIDSDAGTITLKGTQELFTDATLLGNAGGPSALGGNLIISSGRFYSPLDPPATPADINLDVTQTGLTRPQIHFRAGETAIGQPVRGTDGKLLAPRGHFTINRFAQGGFDSLTLNGNVEFHGPITIRARRDLTVASGGVLTGDAEIQMFAGHAMLGTPFLPPTSPDQQTAPFLVNNQPFGVPPTFGPGSLTVTAELIEIGNLALRNIGKASLIADHGDIRGDGTLDIAGDLYLRAGQIYPVTAVQFTIVAYDHTENGVTTPGSITIAGSGQRDLPLSAGGQLSLYASKIEQGGVLRAPNGAIQIGWNDAATAPTDLLSQNKVPLAKEIILSAGSVTSVSLVDPRTGEGALIPYGLSSDGQSWIDPTGTDIAAGKLAGKRISILGDKLSLEAGSTIDLRGDGDLYAYRFNKGTGGSTDLLGWNFVGAWQSGKEYKETQIVSYNGAFWYARGDLGADIQTSAPTPGQNWKQVTQSFAVIPGYQPNFAPYANFAGGNDPGYVTTGLKVGDRIYLDGSTGLAAGTYTLLPARYALMPGAFLVSPQSGGPVGTFANPDGGSFVAGYRFNDLNRERTISATYSRYEVAPGDVVRARGEYVDFFANDFLIKRAQELEVPIPRLPADGGYLRLVAGTALDLKGDVLALGQPRFHDAYIDIASTVADILIAGGDLAPGANQIVLNANRLSKYNAESLLIGGVRDYRPDGVHLTTITNNVTVDNAGAPLFAAEVILAAKKALTLEEGALVLQIGTIARGRADILNIGDPNVAGSRDGVLLRVSSDQGALTLRINPDTTNTDPVLTVKGGVRIAGTSLLLDSTNAMTIDPKTRLDADYVSLNAGQIILQLDPNVVVPNTGLVLGGELLDELQGTKTLSLLTYRTLDIYGAGTFKPDGNLLLHAAEIRGFDNGGGTASISASSITLDNRAGTQRPKPAAGGVGTLELNASHFRIGDGNLVISQFGLVNINAPGGLFVAGSGVTGNPDGLFGLYVSGDFHATTPFVTGARAIKNQITAVGNVTFDATAGGARGSGSALGASLTVNGSSIVANSAFVFHSGSLAFNATGNNPGDGVSVGGILDVSGTAQSLYDVTRYTSAGEIKLASKSGDITIGVDAVLNVSAPIDGGDAGAIAISTPNGQFNLAGKMLGKAGANGEAGSFSLDVHDLATTAAVAATLDDGGFTGTQKFRVRTGDVIIDSVSKARAFLLSTDAGNLTVTGTIDASGVTGGKIELISSGNLTLAANSTLTVAAEKFSNAGKGGAISLEAGSQIDGNVDYGGGAVLDIQTGSTIVLTVDEVDGIADPVQRAAATAAAQGLGKFTGPLHLRAPQNAAGTDVNINTIGGTITGGSSIVVEGYRLWDLQQGGRITNTGAIQALGGVVNGGVNVQGSVKANGVLFTGNTAAISANLFQGANAGLASIASIVPGAEIINRSGDVSIGTNATLTSANDWDLSSYHYNNGVAGPTGVPGVLTIRAAGNLLFFNGLSDGFTSSAFNAQLSDRTAGLSANAQSWSYRLTAGADMAAADFHRVQSYTDLVDADTGSLLLGKHLTLTGSTTAQIVPRLFQVIRTGSGDIDISTGRDVVLQNVFSNIYTAGARLTAAEVSMGGTFDIPQPRPAGVANPPPPQYSLGGGNVTITAQGDIKRDAFLAGADAGTQQQLPFNWLGRRGRVDPTTGDFGYSPITFAGYNDVASTSWWVNFANFFEGVGALGGGDVTMIAGGNVVDVDAVIPTNARMPGKDALTGQPIAPDASKLVELGGGDLLVKAGGNIDGGAYYVERGSGKLRAGAEITTNERRNTIFDNADLSSSENWLPTTLFLGKGSFNVSALGNILLGPTANPFLLPTDFSNDFRYKTFFSTYAATSAVEVTSIGGSITLRTGTAAPAPGNDAPQTAPILDQWAALIQQNATAPGNAARPWLRLTDSEFTAYATNSSLMAPTLKLTAFSGDINLAGNITLAPSPSGTVELLAGQSVNGLQVTGGSSINGVPIKVWSSSQINLSDADPASVNGVATPLAYQNYVLSTGVAANSTTPADFFTQLTNMFTETGSTTNAFSTKLALHGSDLLHDEDPDPARVYALGGDISGLTLFSGKFSQIFSGHDITDISLYLQNVGETDTSIVAAARDIVAYNTNSPLRAMATATGNFISGGGIDAGGAIVIPDSQAGDIQIGGTGALEVLAGRNLDLGTGENRADGTGTGLISIGNGRNPNLPFQGANIIAGAGIGPSAGLSASALDFEDFSEEGMDKYEEELRKRHPELQGVDPKSLTEEQKAVLALDVFFLTLRDAGRAQSGAVTTGAGFEDAYAAIDSLFGSGGGNKLRGDITTKARDIRTRNGGNISLIVPHGELKLSSTKIGNPLIPPGIVTESGGTISIFTNGDVDIGISRIFTLRGGDITIWSSTGDIAAGSSAKTVKSAPPTRVLIDLQSADVKTDLAGLATGGGIGVLATVAGVSPGDVDLIAPKGVVDAGDAGIRATGNLSIAATAVLNASNIQVGGTSTGVPSSAPVSAPPVSVPAGAASAAAATNNASEEAMKQAQGNAAPTEEPPSVITVEVLDLGPDPDGTGSASL